MRLPVLLILLSLAALAASAQGADHLLGRPYASLPGGWAEVSGALLSASADSLSYALSEHHNVHDLRRLFLYSQLDRMVDDRHPIWTVLAALVVEDVREGEIATSFACMSHDDEPVVAVVGEGRIDEGEGVIRYGSVRLAWALDRAANRFIALDPSRVRCPDQDLP